MFDNYRVEIITKNYAEVEAFLKTNNILWEADIELSVVFKDNSKIIATGSLARNIIKGVVVSPAYQDQNLTARVVTELLEQARQKNIFHLFLFTKPSNKTYFTSLGFNFLAEYGLFALLEFGSPNIKDYIRQIPKANKNLLGAVVVNCNPFTLGHKYLIEEALSQVDYLYVFVVQEDLSVFPFSVRFNLIEKGLKEFKNVKVVSGEDYIVSAKTFPSYFLKNEKNDDIVKSQAGLDVTLFATQIAKPLGLSHRFVGTEPYCATTTAYNKAMKEILPKYKIELIEILRKEVTTNDFISASKVRQLIHEDKLEDAKKYLPKTTYDFLKSKEAKEIIKRIKESTKRH